MPKPATTLVQIVVDYATHAGYVALSTAVASTSAPTEPTGGSPAYARQASNWGTPNSTTGVNTASPAAHNVPSGSNIQSAAFMSALTGGTMYESTALTAQNFVSQGTYSATLTITPS